MSCPRETGGVEREPSPEGTMPHLPQGQKKLIMDNAGRCEVPHEVRRSC